LEFKNSNRALKFSNNSKLNLIKLNGIEVLLNKNSNSKLAYIILVSKVGSRYEDKAGITHFLEHNIFRGSKKYSYFQINEFFELYGNSIDAWTTKENLVIFTSVLSEFLIKSLDIIFDIILNPTFENYENEKNVIIQEYKEILDNYEERSYYYLNKAIFKNHPLSREIIGTPSNIKKFNKYDLIKRKNEVFSKNNLVLLIGGNFNEDEVLKFISENFYLDNEYNFKINHFKNYKPSEIKKFYGNYHSYVSMGIPIFNYHNLRTALILASHMLGIGSSSILFDIIREKKALVYDIHTFLDFYSEVAIFGINYSVERKYNNKVISEISSILKNLDSYIKNFDKIKQKFKTSTIIELDNYLNSLFFSLNEYINYNKILKLDEFIYEIENLSFDEFLKVIEIISKFENYSFGILE